MLSNCKQSLALLRYAFNPKVKPFGLKFKRHIQFFQHISPGFCTTKPDSATQTQQNTININKTGDIEKNIEEALKSHQLKPGENHFTLITQNICTLLKGLRHKDNPQAIKELEAYFKFPIERKTSTEDDADLLNRLKCYTEILANYRELDLKNAIALADKVGKFIENGGSLLSKTQLEYIKKQAFESLNPELTSSTFRFWALMVASRIKSGQTLPFLDAYCNPSIIQAAGAKDIGVLASCAIIIIRQYQAQNKTFNAPSVDKFIKLIEENKQQIFEDISLKGNDLYLFISALALEAPSLKPETVAAVNSFLESKWGELDPKLKMKIFSAFVSAKLLKSQVLMKDYMDYFKFKRFLGLQQSDLYQIISQIDELRGFSKELYLSFVEGCYKNTNFLDDQCYFLLFGYIEEPKFTNKLLKKLEKKVIKRFQEGTVTPATLCKYSYKMTKFGMIDIEFFKQVEKYFCENLKGKKLKLSLGEAHNILSACTSLNFIHSPLYEAVTPNVIEMLRNQTAFHKSYYLLISEMSRCSVKYDEALIKEVLKYMVRFSKESLNEKNFSLFCQGIQAITRMMVPHLINNSQKSTFTGFLMPEIQQIGTQALATAEKIAKGKKPQNYADLFKIAQFALTLQIEYPSLFPNTNNTANNIINEVIRLGKMSKPKGAATDLEFEIFHELDKMEIKYEKEAKIFVYQVDILIKPNLIVEIDGVKHFDRANKKRAAKDILRFYHFRNLGYKIVTIPYYEFRENEQQKAQEYLRSKIYGSELSLEELI